MGAYMGLAVPMAGAYTRKNATGTDVMTVCKDGYTTVTLAQDTAYMTTSPGGVEGIRFRLNVTADTTGSSCAAFWMDHQSGSSTGALLCAAEFWITGASDMAAATGQIACINLTNYLTAGYAVTTSNSAYIKIRDAGADIPNIFLITGVTADASGGPFFAATNTTIDHALRIYVNNTTYYIGLYDALCT